ncbi:MAG: ADP-ribosylglycohydrolase family protein [Chloroflexi bacterium]|jgi:ADP-ribosylglycohydrolase|nr:ADP-ribosylglycohydrolase family protein [Chloroflexota bacterium]
MLRDVQDYYERVYAGVLGKIIGVYLGRPFEGWTYEQIMARLGEVKFYVHEHLAKPLIVVDDDISGTFAFLRAMPDSGNTLDLTAAQIGDTWLNYLIENKTILWWGGLGMSTENTAYLRLAQGIRAPESGSMALNGQLVAEQIGAQIFIDGWAMIAPGEPELAADLARRAASVSHDGVAIHGAQVVAAMEAQAFVEPDIDRLLDVGQGVIPRDSLINRLIDDLRSWRVRYSDWHDAFAQIAAHYGYDKYGGNCHMVPNHALIILALLYSDDSFSRALSIVNTAGWDTDCNAGNVGCLMGIKNGLAGLDDGPDWRGPVADRMYVAAAEAGRTVTDAVLEAQQVINIHQALDGGTPWQPKQGARYHFELPGAVQGFQPDDSPLCRGTVWVENIGGHSAVGQRALAMHLSGLADGRLARVLTETLPAMSASGGYRMVACPTLYPGQTVRARLEADRALSGPVQVRLVVLAHGPADALEPYGPPALTLAPGKDVELAWTVDLPAGCPAAAVGLEFASTARVDGTVYLDWLTWSGAPTLRFDQPAHAGQRWLDTWAVACTDLAHGRESLYTVIQNRGLGMILQGTRDWRDYTVHARCQANLSETFGLAARVQGLERYYALELVKGGVARLVERRYERRVLAEARYDWALYRWYDLKLTVQGNRLQACIDGQVLFDRTVNDPFEGGGIGLLIEEGRLNVDAIEVKAL